MAVNAESSLQRLSGNLRRLLVLQGYAEDTMERTCEIQHGFTENESKMETYN